MSRRRHPPPVGTVDLGDLATVEPVSRAFGGDRGTPVDRHYIERFLARHAALVRGRVLEVGDSHYTRRFGADRVTRADVVDAPGSENPRATHRADLAGRTGLPIAAYDCVILTQTLHMIYDHRAVVRTMRRILKPGGTCLATVPGITQIDAADGPDLWFFPMTQSAARRLFAERFGDGAVAVEPFGNVYAATAFLQGLALEEVDREKLDHPDPLYPVITGVRATRAA